MPLSTIEFEKRGSVAEIRLNRPEKLNAINSIMIDELESVLNKSELDELGYASTETIPVLFDLSRATPDKPTLTNLERNRQGTQVLFVGRVAPNKAHHDLIAAVRTLREAKVNS